MAQVDAAGNVNVAKFGTRVAGVGGFVNITQTAKRLVFCGTFTARGLEARVGGNRLQIIQEGEVCKFATCVDQISFSAERARQISQDVMYITERAVFRLDPEGVQLAEIAPGIDIQEHVFDVAGFKPLVRDVRPMPEYLFQ